MDSSWNRHLSLNVKNGSIVFDAMKKLTWQSMGFVEINCLFNFKKFSGTVEVQGLYTSHCWVQASTKHTLYLDVLRAQSPRGPIADWRRSNHNEISMGNG